MFDCFYFVLKLVKKEEFFSQIIDNGFWWFYLCDKPQTGVTRTQKAVSCKAYFYDKGLKTIMFGTSKKTNELFDFFNQYRENGIKMNIGSHFEYLYK